MVLHLKNKGVQPLLDAVIDYLPTPLDRPFIEGWTKKDKKQIMKCSTDFDKPLIALAFKLQADPFAGTLTYLRVYSGILKTGMVVQNSSISKKERIGHLVKMHADSRAEVDQIRAGDIGAAIGLKWTRTGHTLCDKNNIVILEDIVFPEPVISVAIELKTTKDEKKLKEALERLKQEDPSFTVKEDLETGQTLISGMGELHLEILVERLKSEFQVQVNCGKPQVSYREKITQVTSGEGKLLYNKEKDTDKKGQYAHVVVELAPLEKNKGIVIENTFKTKTVPQEFISSALEGMTEALTNGILLGYPIIDVKASLTHASFHEQDSSLPAFKIAGVMAVKEALRKNTSYLLEPIFKLEVITPQEFLKNVIGNLNAKRGNILQVATKGHLQVIEAEAPVAELFGYATTLRSMTQGRAQFSMEFSYFERLPKKQEQELFVKHGISI